LETLWDTLCVHKNDHSLNKPYGASRWQIEAQGKSYRIFRVVSTGKNSYKPGKEDVWSDVLVMGGFEVHGPVDFLDTK
jgi:hypothetical protein